MSISNQGMLCILEERDIWSFGKMPNISPTVDFPVPFGPNNTCTSPCLVTSFLSYISLPANSNIYFLS
jgi:hypothetical protein